MVIQFPTIFVIPSLYSGQVLSAAKNLYHVGLRPFAALRACPERSEGVTVNRELNDPVPDLSGLDSPACLPAGYAV
jgi:hypothetical protein